MIALGTLTGILTAAGILLAIQGLRRTPEPPPRPRKASKRPSWAHLDRTEQVLAAAAAAAGLVFALLTGWLVTVLLAPIAAIGLRRILDTRHQQQQIERLEALAEWTRGLSAILSTSGGLTDALIASQRSTPAPIRTEVTRMVSRLQARRPAPKVLADFADDLDSDTGDLVAATLLLGATETGQKLSTILNQLAAAVADKVRVQREVEAERAGPRSQARILSVIFIAGLAAFIFGTSFGQHYRTGAGQIALLIVAAALGGCLFWLRQVTVVKPHPRFLVDNTQER